MNEDKAKELYERYVQLQEQAQALDHHLQSMQEQQRNLKQTQEMIAQLQSMQEPTESWIPIAPGAYIKAIAKPLDTILINIGAAVAVEKTPADVLVTLQEHQKVLDELSAEALKELQQILEEIEVIKKQVEAGA